VIVGRFKSNKNSNRSSILYLSFCVTFVEKCVEHIHAKSFLFCKVKLLPYLAELHVKIVKFFAPSPLIYFIQPHFGPFSFYISQVFSAEFSIHFYLLNPISSFFSSFCLSFSSLTLSGATYNSSNNVLQHSRA
jgi:hypothetical protein